MDTYAGYIKSDEIIKSASGGAVSFISSQFVKNGVVYGVRYEEDFKGAVYDFAENDDDLEKFKSSKYCRTKKNIVTQGITGNVYKDVAKQLKKGRNVLFIGLGCDIAALKSIVNAENCSSERLYIIELLCDGVVPQKVQEKYIEELEKRYASKVTRFNLRHKKYGWQLYDIYVEFENGQQYSCPFDISDYGVAFGNYKEKGCYSCRYKGAQKHPGDMIAGDFWGCNRGMSGYNPNGVSLMIPLTEKGKKLLELLDDDAFYKINADSDVALYNQPRFFTAHATNPEWSIFDENFKANGLRYAVDLFGENVMPERFKRRMYKKFVVWGTGNTFLRCIDFIENTKKIDMLVDGNEKQWGKTILGKYNCVSPHEITKLTDSFVMIAVQDKMKIFEIINRLNDYGTVDYDVFDNWRWYRNRISFEK